jgi:hypothetical protein
MGELIAKASKGDALLITFSGHGTYQPDTDGDEVDGLDEALCPYDLQTNGEALTDDEIRNLFLTRKAGVRIVLISDSCHSGTVTRAAKAEKDADSRPRFMPMGNWLPDKLLPRNRAGKVAATMTGPAGTTPFFGAYSNKLGDLLLKREIAGFTRTLGSLLRNGVPILNALSIASVVMGIIPIRQEIDKVFETIRGINFTGEFLIDSIRMTATSSPAISPLTVRKPRV